MRFDQNPGDLPEEEHEDLLEEESHWVPDETEDHPPPKPKKKSLLKRLLKFLFLTGLTLVLLLIGAVIALEFYFPSEKLTPIAQRELSRLLKMPVAIRETRLSLLRGIEVHRVSLGGTPALLRLNALILDYDLSQLLKGEFVINQVIVDQPHLTLISKNGVWNFQPLLELLEKPEPTPSAKEPPSGLPPIPVAVDLRNFAIQNIRMDLDIDGKTRARLEGLTLQAKGKAGPDTIEAEMRVTFSPPASGTSPHNVEFSSTGESAIEVKTLLLTNFKAFTPDLNRVQVSGTGEAKNSVVRMGRALPAPNLAVRLNLDAALKEQRSNLSRLLLTIGDGNRVDLSGKADHFLSNPEFRVRLKEAVFSIPHLISWAESFVGPQNIDAEGKIRVTGLEVTGTLPGFQPGNIEVRGGAKVTAEVPLARLPNPPASLIGAGAVISLNRVKLESGKPTELEADIGLKLERGRVQDLFLRRFNHDLHVSLKGPRLEQAGISFFTSLGAVEFAHPDFGSLKTPLRLEGSLAGNLSNGNIDTFQVLYLANPFLNGAMRGKAKAFGKESLQMQHDLTVRLNRVSDVLPPALRKKAGNLQLGGEVKLVTAVKGRLDNNFHPTASTVQTRLDMRGIEVEMGTPSIRLKQFGARVTVPLEYDPAMGVKISNLKIQAAFDRLEALGRWAVGPAQTETRLSMNRFFPLTELTGTVPIILQTQLKAGRIRSLKPNLLLTGLDVDATLKSDLAPKDVRNLTLKGEVSLADAEGMGKFKSGKTKTAFQVDVHDLTLSRVRTTLKTRVAAPVFRDEEMRLAPGPISFETLAHLNLEKGTADIRRVNLKMPSILELTAKAQAKNWGQIFDLENLTSKVHLGALWDALPQTLRAGMEGLEIDGTASLKLAAQGEIPQETALKKLNLPLSALADFGLQNVSLSWPARGLRVEKVNNATRFSLQENNIMISGQLESGQVFLPDLLGKAPLNPRFDFLYRLTDFNKLTLEKHALAVKSWGIQHLLKGRVDGLKPFLSGRAEFSPVELARRLDILLETSNRLSVDRKTAERLAVLAGKLRVDGSVASRLRVGLTAGKTLELDGAVEFDGFNLGLPPALSVQDVDGKFLFNKKLVIDAQRTPEKAEKFFVAQKGFFSQLRDFSRYKNILKIRSIGWDKHRADNIGLDLFFKDNRLMVEKFLFDILNGSVAGNLFLVQTDEGPALNFSTEFAGLDFAELVKGIAAKTETADSEVDGNMQFSFQVRQGSKDEKIAIDQIAAKFAITRIGAETLDRVLLFLDPEESKPAIVDTRAKLKLASPHQLRLTLENGNLNVEAWLKNKILGTILKAPELKRVPITSLKQFRAINEQLQALTGLRDALRYLAAQGIAFDEEEGVVLF